MRRSRRRCGRRRSPPGTCRAGGSASAPAGRASSSGPAASAGSQGTSSSSRSQSTRWDRESFRWWTVSIRPPIASPSEPPAQRPAEVRAGPLPGVRGLPDGLCLRRIGVDDRGQRAEADPATIATVISLIISPAWRATIVAPRIRSVPSRTWIFTKPHSSPSAMARSTSCIGTVNVFTGIPRSRASRT